MKTIFKGFLYAIIINSLIGFGYYLGLNKPVVYKCPEVKDSKVITTINNKNKQTCVYVQHDKVYGRATARVRL